MNPRAARILEFAPGETVCRQGTRAERAYILKHGSVRSTVLPDAGLGSIETDAARGHTLATHDQQGTLLGCEGVLAGHYVDSLISVGTSQLIELPLDTPGVMSAISEDTAFGLALSRSLARRLVAANKNLGTVQRLAARFTRELQGLCADFYNLVQRLGEEAAGDDTILQALNAAKRTQTYAVGESGGGEVTRQTRRVMSRVVETAEQGGQRVELKAGDVLCRRGDPGDTVYVLVSGRLSVRIGAEQYGVIRPGEIVGEIGALLGEEEPRRIADVVADEASVVGSIPVARFPTLLEKQPKLLVNLCKLLTLRVKGFEQLAAESDRSLQLAAEKFAGPRTAFVADLNTLRRALEAAIKDFGLPLTAEVAALHTIEERWQQKIKELQTKVSKA